jgi:hypothetical protein
MMSILVDIYRQSDEMGRPRPVAKADFGCVDNAGDASTAAARRVCSSPAERGAGLRSSRDLRGPEMLRVGPRRGIPWASWRLASVDRPQLPAFRGFADGVRQWRTELLAYFDPRPADRHRRLRAARLHSPPRGRRDLHGRFQHHRGAERGRAEAAQTARETRRRAAAAEVRGAAGPQRERRSARGCVDVVASAHPEPGKYVAGPCGRCALRRLLGPTIGAYVRSEGPYDRDRGPST